ncbi:hypothetical protein HBI56_000440 [Parastagonospora nodorum]|nr:hypothetical protein HBH51_032380 [Parastagonospora nodorum]KAH4229279.1 hypothetical protein HBI06_089230 [Parastagonospora nodorum]KAH4249133.1 hypothetical protein HBI05_001190 [Parastagonospora nodorum]KAH4352100.1 hypothetical protein HBH98_016520 [Parastagonospora nodorum]KAH4381752.1 hypothetical protein HBH97_089690 [Parastagonospora nodorum]
MRFAAIVSVFLLGVATATPTPNVGSGIGARDPVAQKKKNGRPINGSNETCGKCCNAGGESREVCCPHEFERFVCDPCETAGAGLRKC